MRVLFIPVVLLNYEAFDGGQAAQPQDRMDVSWVSWKPRASADVGVDHLHASRAAAASHVARLLGTSTSLLTLHRTFSRVAISREFWKLQNLDAHYTKGKSYSFLQLTCSNNSLADMDKLKGAVGLGGKDQEGQEPVSGAKGEGTAPEPFDAGNKQGMRSPTCGRMLN